MAVPPSGVVGVVVPAAATGGEREGERDANGDRQSPILLFIRLLPFGWRWSGYRWWKRRRAHRALRVERVAQSVAEEVEGQHGDEDRHARPEHEVRHRVVVAPPRESMPPQVAVGGRMPTPRKDSAASNRMFVGISSVA